MYIYSIQVFYSNPKYVYDMDITYNQTKLQMSTNANQWLVGTEFMLMVEPILGNPKEKEVHHQPQPPTSHYLYMNVNILYTKAIQMNPVQ